MENQSAKRIRDDEEDSISMDRISELPQPILHHILSLLSQKQSIQTCVLAKSWRHLGSTRPKLEFSDRHTQWHWSAQKFLNVVDKTLQRYEDQNLSIQEFLLEVSGSDIVPFLEKWIPIVLSLRGVKKLYLNFCNFDFFFPRGVPGYALPQVVYQVESIQELNLVECRLNKISSIEKVMFKNLQTLSLFRVEIEDETFEKIMSNCPLIQILVLNKCPGLGTVEVKNAHNLKNFDCHLFANEPNTEIDTPTTLQSIRIGNCPNWYCYHSNKFFPNLKSLYMFKIQLSAKSFGIFSSNNIPCLEDLELDYCFGFKEFELSSRSIKRLIISVPVNKSLISAVIDGPNILYFKLSCGTTVPSAFSLTKTFRCEWKSDIRVTCFVDNNNDRLSTWFLKLGEMLKALSESQITLHIHCIVMHGQNIEDTFEGFNEPVVVEHLSLRGFFSSPRFPGFLNDLFSICRPRYIYPPISDGESVCKVLVQERERMEDLEDIITEEEKGYDGEEWPDFLASASIFYKEYIRHRLKWRELI